MLHVAAIQYRPPRAAPAQARAELAELVAAAVDGGAQLIVCPEMSVTGYVWNDADELRPHAEPADGPTAAALAAVAGDATIVAGIAEIGEDGALYNSAVWIDRGRVAGRYRKVALFELDTLWACAGSERAIFDTACGRVVPGICMDLNDDDFVAHAREAGARAIAFCTNWLDEGFSVAPYWRWRLRSVRAPVVAANTWGRERGVAFRGESAVLGPGGEVLAVAPRRGNAVVLAEVPAAPAEDTRPAARSPGPQRPGA